ncbi:hypothetical protein D3C76_1285670 [compost metagenome]
MQRAALQQVDDLVGAGPLLLAVPFAVIQHVEIAHQQQPAYSCAGHAGDQRLAHAQLRGKVVRRQCRQQADHRRTASYALFSLIGVVQAAGLEVQAGAWRQAVEVIDHGDHLVLALEQFGHQGAAQAAQSSEQGQFEHWGFGIFHQITPLAAGDHLTRAARCGFVMIQEFSCRGSRVITPISTMTPAPWNRPGNCVKKPRGCFR